jgi:hypothetical protein
MSGQRLQRRTGAIRRFNMITKTTRVGARCAGGAATGVAAGMAMAMGLCVMQLITTVEAQGRPQSNEYLAKGANGLFELRIYTINPTKIANTYKFMNNVVAFQASTHMNIIGTFPDLDAGKYIWFRNYPNPKALDERYRATYDSETWKSGTLRGGITDTGIAFTNVYLATATKYSKLQSPYVQKPEAAVPTDEARSLSKMYAESKDGEVPNCGRCGSNPFIFEVTLHDVKVGMMDSYVEHMGQYFARQEAKGIRVFAQMVAYAKVTGLNNGGSFVPENTTFISIRLFPDEATRKKQEASLGEDSMAVAKAAEMAGRAGLNTIVYSGHPAFYSGMQQ